MFGDAMNFLNDTHYIGADLKIDYETIENEINEITTEGLDFYKKVIYIGKKGTALSEKFRNDITHKMKVEWNGKEYHVSIEEYKK